MTSNPWHRAVAAVNSLKAFTRAVDALRGEKLTDEESGALVDHAQELIQLLN